MAPPKRTNTDTAKKRRRGDVDDKDDDNVDFDNDMVMKDVAVAVAADDEEDDDDVVVVTDPTETTTTTTGTQQKVKRARKATATKSTIATIPTTTTATTVPASTTTTVQSATTATASTTRTQEQQNSVIGGVVPTYTSSPRSGIPRQPVRAIPTVDALKMPSAHTPGKQQRRPSMTTQMITPMIQFTGTPSLPSKIDTTVVAAPPTSTSTINRLVLDIPTAAAVPAPTSSTTSMVQVETVSEDDSQNKEKEEDDVPMVDNDSISTQQQQSTSEFLQQTLKSILVLKQLQSPLVWFLLLLIPQMIFFQPLWSFVIATSDNGLVMYKGLYESIFPTSLIPISENISSTITGTIKSLNDTKNSMVSTVTMQKDIDTIKGLLNELTTSQQTLKELQQSLDNEIEKNFETIRTTDNDSDITSLVVTLQDSVSELNSLSKLINNTNVTDHYTTQELLLVQSIRDKLIDESKLVDLSKLELWDLSTTVSPPNSDCSADLVAIDEEGDDDTDDTSNIKGVTLDNVSKWLNGIVENTIEQIQGIVSHEHDSITAVQAWIQHETQLIVNKLHQRTIASDLLVVDGDDDGDEKSSNVPSTVSSIDRFRQIIQTQLDIEHADQTGRIDYAMIANGAKVITTGMYKTSRSLIQDMPLLNKLAHTLQVRFYGYGPQIALTPTYPMNALGQCWAFSASPDTTNSLGMLTVQLAKSVYIHELVLEHPYYEITDRTETAPRKFTVFGYEDAIITNDSKEYNLGTFEYVVSIDDDDNDNDSTPERLQFFINDDSTIPKVSTIRLVIESNWGGEYTCLYRFRVHGSEDVAVVGSTRTTGDEASDDEEYDEEEEEDL